VPWNGRINGEIGLGAVDGEDWRVDWALVIERYGAGVTDNEVPEGGVDQDSRERRFSATAGRIARERRHLGVVDQRQRDFPQRFSRRRNLAQRLSRRCHPQMKDGGLHEDLQLSNIDPGKS
jgi:hypothetical protein